MEKRVDNDYFDLSDSRNNHFEKWLYDEINNIIKGKWVTIKFSWAKHIIKIYVLMVILENSNLKDQHLANLVGSIWKELCGV